MKSHFYFNKQFTLNYLTYRIVRELKRVNYIHSFKNSFNSYFLNISYLLKAILGSDYRAVWQRLLFDP